MICILGKRRMSIKETNIKSLISATINDNNGTETIITLLKDEDIDEYYLTVSIFGWKQVSEIQKNFALLIRYKYSINKCVVPLIYYILTFESKKIENILEFLYNNYYLYPVQDEEE